MKQTDSEQGLVLVERKLPLTKGRLTPQDAATATGITVDEARDALTRLMELYVTRVTHDDQGNILYAFEFPLRRRGTKTAAEKWAELKDALWRGFKVFFKIWIGLMVVVYFVVMLVLLVALLLAQRSGSNDRDDNDGGGMVTGLLRVMMEGLAYAFWFRATPGMGFDVDSHGYRYRRANVPRGAGKNSREKSFIIAIYDLALGPERTGGDPLENEKEVAAFLRAEGGVLAPAEIVALSGSTLADAEERMADYLVRFKGEPVITDEGVVIGEFEAFVSGTQSRTDTAIIPYWDEFEAPYEHSGNSAGRNAAIIAMVLVTLGVGVGLLAGGLNTLMVYGSFFGTSLARFLLGYFPIAFSIAYFGISLARLPAARVKEAARLARNREKKIMRVIFQQRLWRASADQIYFALVSLGEKEMRAEHIAPIMQKILPKLQGTIELDDEGTPIYTFDRLQREVEAAERSRTQR